MANVEAASAAGPRYAPDDPTLPKPWRGLIDGSTGLTYYWNPETNVTQYEKPGVSAPPTLPSGVPPTDSMSQSAPNAVTQHGQASDAYQYHQQYPNQMSPQQEQFQGSLGGWVNQQPPAQILPAGQQGSQFGAFHHHHHHPQYGTVAPQGGSKFGQQGPMVQQQYGTQMPPPIGQQQLPQQGSPMTHQPVQQMSPASGQQGPPHQGPQGGQPSVDRFIPQQMPYANYQQFMWPQGHPNAQAHPQPMPQGPPPFTYQQGNRNGLPARDDTDFSLVKQTGMSGSHVEQSGGAVGQGPPSGNATNHALQGSTVPGQAQSFGSSVHLNQPAPSVKLHENWNDAIQSQHASPYQNLKSQPIMHSQQQHQPPFGSKMGYEDNHPARAPQGYHSNSNNDIPAMGPQHPKLAAIPMVRNQQESVMGGFPLRNAPSAHDNGVNTIAPHGQQQHGLFDHAKGDLPMSNHGLSRPPPTMPGSADVMNISSVEAYLQQHEVTATGDNVPAPFMTFEATGFPPEIVREMHAAGFCSPTPIQAQTWPIALQNRDIVAIAKTGSGKTLGYLVPAFIHLRRRGNSSRNGPTVLVLAPTRELATQIQEEAIKFGRSSRISCVCLYGGSPKSAQVEKLRQGADIVVATPGRLNDILETRDINVRQVSLLVLDEADRMLDMGFEPQFRKIVNEIPRNRQTLMYTATWPKEVMKIASDLLNSYVQVNIGNVDELAANKSITQYVEVVPQMEKQRRLEQILGAQERGSKVIVFCSTKKMCDELARSIRRNFPAAAIHGDKSQGERDYVLNQFRSGKVPILVATDVAARGLDIKDIRVVINYDFPTGIEDYVHRIGRTGRAGATGVAHTFLSEQDWKYAPDLVKVLEGANQPVPPEVRDMAVRGRPIFDKDRGGVNRFDSGPAFGAGRWDSGGRGGMRDGGFNGRGGMRDGGFGGRGVRDGNFGFRGGGGGGMRDGGFGGRSMRDGAVSGRGGRGDFGGRGNRGGRGGFSGPGGGFSGRPRDDYSPQERFPSRDGFGRGRGRGRFDSRRDVGGRSRGRSYSSSPEKVRTWGYSRSPSRSQSRSRSWSRSRSPRRSYSRSRSRSRGPRRSYSRSRSRSLDRGRGRSRSPRYEWNERPARRSNWDQRDPPQAEPQKQPDAGSYEQENAIPPTSMPQVPPFCGDANDKPVIGDDPRITFEDKGDPVSLGVDQSAAP